MTEQRRPITQEEYRAMQNGVVPMIDPQPQPEPEPEPDEAAGFGQNQEQEKPDEFQVSRDMYESIGRQYMAENAPIPLRQQFSQMAPTPPQGEALIEWSRGTLFGVSIGIAVGAGIAYLVVRNYNPPEENTGSSDESS